MGAFLILLLILGIGVAISSFYIVPEYNKAVIFRFGRFNRVGGPGQIFVLPLVEKFVEVSMKDIILYNKIDDACTKDKKRVSAKVIISYKIVDAFKASMAVYSLGRSINILVDWSVNDVFSQYTKLDISKKGKTVVAKIEKDLQGLLKTWGIKINFIRYKTNLLEK